MTNPEELIGRIDKVKDIIDSRYGDKVKLMAILGQPQHKEECFCFAMSVLCTLFINNEIILKEESHVE